MIYIAEKDSKNRILPAKVEVHFKARATILDIEFSSVVIGINRGACVTWVHIRTELLLLFDEKGRSTRISGCSIKPNPVAAMTHEFSSRPTQRKVMGTD
jgi:hypothetical protein